MDREKLKEHVREFWAVALGDDVIVDDDTDYFEVGGHSFMATVVLAELESIYSARLPLKALFDNPRLADFVEAVALEIESTAHAERCSGMSHTPTGSQE